MYFPGSHHIFIQQGFVSLNDMKAVSQAEAIAIGMTFAYVCPVFI